MKAKIFWCVKGGVYPVTAKPVKQQNATVYRSSAGITYAARHIRTWDELTNNQKAEAYRSVYKTKMRDARWSVAKDPSLESRFPVWKEQLERDRDNAIALIERGELVAPPSYF